MTASVDLQEFLGAYVAEAEEQVSLANGMLLEIEASLRARQANPRAVRDLFRALHTQKGLSAMVGVEPIVAIAHRMESSLRTVDQEGGRLTTESVDTLLKGVRAIEQRVRAASPRRKRSRRRLARCFEELDALDASAGWVRAGRRRLTCSSSMSPSRASLPLSRSRRSQRLQRTGGGRSAWTSFPRPSGRRRASPSTAFASAPGASPEIVKVIPTSVPRSAEAPGGISFVLLMLTSASDASIAAAVGVDPGGVIPLVPSSALSPAGAPAFELPADMTEDLESASLQRRNIVRVDVHRLDDAMEQLSALIVTRSRLARVASEMTETGANTRELAQIVRENARQLRDLRAAILRVRMVPVTEVLDRVPLIVRGLRRESGKQIRVVIDASNAELDKAVAERIFPAIVHIVRNAADHAIESPDERAAAGKPHEATVTLTCTAHSNTRLELSIADDGRGIDRSLVSRRAGREIALTDHALLDALCEAGLSTRAKASTTSGRGMGMDIVKRIVVDQLGGELLMKTQPGHGTTFTLQSPAHDRHRRRFHAGLRGPAIRRSRIHGGGDPRDPSEERERERPGRAMNDRSGFTSVIGHRGEAVALVDLAEAFRLPSSGHPLRQALLVRRNGEAIAFALEKVRGQQEAVIRPLIDPLVQVPGISGATDLGDGKPTLVLDLIFSQRYRARARKRAGGMTALARHADSPDTVPVLHVVFKVGGSEYLLPTETVVQIESFTGATIVPGAPEFVAGIVQIRGRVVPVIDMRRRFQQPAAEPTLDSRIVVGQRGERLVGLLVDAAREVLKVPPSELKPPPRLLEDQSGGFIKAVAQVGPRLLLLIDFAKVIGEEIVDVG